MANSMNEFCIEWLKRGRLRRSYRAIWDGIEVKTVKACGGTPRGSKDYDDKPGRFCICPCVPCIHKS